MTVRTYLRKTEDWGNLTFEQFKPQASINNDKIEAAVRLWDQNLLIPYFQYRAMIKSIAESTWKNVFTCPDQKFAEVVSSFDDDDFIVPTDDDDWFDDGLYEFLDGISVHMTKADMLEWNCVVHQTIRPANCHHWHDHHNVPCSNNYAVRVRALKKLEPVVQFNMLNQHSKARKYAKDMLCHNSGVEFSVYNIHPGSAHRLKSVRTPEQLLELFSPNKPRTTGWIEPLSKRFCDVLGRVYRGITLL